MKFTLTDYQHKATTDTVNKLTQAFNGYGSYGLKASVGLTAPTGAGKTVIATAVLEKLLFGDADRAANRKLTVLWLTDDPSLNAQSRDKILKASSVIQPSQIVMVDSTYDEETFESGKIHFLNIGRLGSGATAHIATGDNRRWSLWETIGNTLERRNADFLFIVDEAHRGSSIKAGEKKTIMRTVLDGGPVTIPDASGATRTIINHPVAVMLGISATPKKFEAAMEDGTSDRTLMRVSADADMVRASGMVKDRIRVFFPSEDQPAPNTLVRTAVRALVKYDELWCRQAAGSDKAVKPLLVIQVPDKISEATVGTLVASLTDEWKELDHRPGTPAPIVHAFGEKVPLDLPGGRSIPHMAPELIEENNHVRVVIFKSALTTGWDCPRAEVMVSLRAAKEHTAIAQLIGRMVRTPLARRIDDAGLEELNSVSLYLPHYSKAEVKSVVTSFVGDADVEVPVEINPVVFGPAPGVPKHLWDLELPKEVKPKKSYPSVVSRLAALGTRLDNLGIQKASKPELSFTEEVWSHLTSVLMDAYLDRKAGFDRDAAKHLNFGYAGTDFDQYNGEELSESTENTDKSGADIHGLKTLASRKLPDGAGDALYCALYEMVDDHHETVAVMYTLSQDQGVLDRLEKGAERKIEQWRGENSSAISRLMPDEKIGIDALCKPKDEPSLGIFRLPASVTTKTQRIVAGKEGDIEDIMMHPRHVFADESGQFPMFATGWERKVLAQELSRNSLIGWYRNPASASQGLSVSYKDGSLARSVYPDFLFFHEVDGRTVVDIVDPHSHSLGDAGKKWSALARFARTNPHPSIRRITAVIEDKHGVLRGLDLSGRASTELEERLARSTSEDIVEVFEEFGGNY